MDSIGLGSAPVTPPPVLRVIDSVVRVVAYLCGFVIVLMMVHVIADVVLRTALNSPLPATLEIVANWWMVAIAFLGLGFAKAREEHVAVTLLTGDGAPPRLRWLGTIVVEVVTIVVLGVLIHFSTLAAIDATARGQHSAGVVPIPTWPSRFLIPLGALLFALTSLKNLVVTITAGPRRFDGEEVAS